MLHSAQCKTPKMPSKDQAEAYQTLEKFLDMNLEAMRDGFGLCDACLVDSLHTYLVTFAERRGIEVPK